TYTQETIIQAAQARLTIAEVPVDFRKRPGRSRLISSLYGYARQSCLVLLMGYLNYKPLKVFLAIGGSIVGAGILCGAYVLRHFILTGQVSPHIPLSIVSVALLLFGGQIIAIGLVAEMIKNNRRIEEEILYRQKKELLAAKRK
ncbi:MAG: glycosyltransferase family 2 protein, partial [Candidatus Diapherotrites archaeon]|nr:glycosyltransferase family 2 protein [Candidatus Diapherotrites archaeon]